ncbi:MAG TPA: cytochrome b N-terminal domain-containing protein, partial [Vicinamibacterales bacterium]
MLQETIDWLDERVDLSEIRHFVREKGVPVHAQKVWYYLGGMTLFLFGVQIATGILLLLYYRPSATEAYESVQFIVTKVEFGWLIRNLHSWSANLLILLAFAHFFSVFLLKSYRKPRELTWVSGVLLLFLMLAFGFSGYLLPWNALAFFATKVGTEVAGVIPFAGHFLLRFLRGGDEVTGATLTRFFGFHVAILPATCT